MNIGESISYLLSLGFLIILGLAPVVCVLWMVCNSIANRRKEKLEEYRKLKQFADEEIYYFKKENNYSNDKVLRKFFSDKYNYKRAKELKIENDWIRKYYSPFCNEDSLKEKRMYSYKYERVVYEIFGKWGYHLSDDVWLIHKELDPNYIIREIAKLLRLNLAESIKLFDELIQNDLIQYTDQYNKWSCVLGYTLHNWNCISNDDYSFSKWKNDSLIYTNPYSTLDDFYNAFGDYSIVNKDNNWLLEYNRSSKEKLHVRIDDEFLIGEIEGKFSALVSKFSFGKDDCEETKQKIVNFISDNKDSLYIENGLSLRLNIRHYKENKNKI